MSILTLAQYRDSFRQKILFRKTGAGSSSTAAWMSCWAVGALPPAGSIVISDTAAGWVPDSSTVGARGLFTGFTGTGYLTGAPDWFATVPCRLMLADRLYHAGQYNFNSNVTLASQPSFSSRIPGGTDYKGLQLWVEMQTGTGIQNIAITYTDQDGNTGASTSVSYNSANTTSGGMFQVPLASGDSGLQKIESVLGTTATVGTFNLVILRPLWHGRQNTGYFGPEGVLESIGLPQVFTDSCLTMLAYPESGNFGTCSFEAMFEIASA